MQLSVMHRMVPALVLAVAMMLAPPPVWADSEAENKPPAGGTGATTETETGDAKTGAAETAPQTSPDCKNVQFAVKNVSGQAVKLISVDYQTGRRWNRGPIVFRTIDNGGSHVWTGSFKDLAGKEVSFRVNTRYVLDPQTDRYSDLNSALVRSAACASDETHTVTIGEP